MKRTLANIIQHSFIFLLAGLCFSCIHEDQDVCPPVDPDPNPDPYEVRFVFDYPLKNENSGVGFDPADVKNIQVYVFDEEGKYMDTFIDNSPAIAEEDYFFRVTLEDAGTYSFIVFGNLTDEYLTEPATLENGVTHIDEISYYYNNRTNKTNNTITTRPNHLFYSSLRNAIITKSVDRYTLSLVRNTYVMNFVTEGLPESYENYQFNITDTNWKYKFDNTFNPCYEIDYVQNCGPGNSSGQYEATFTTLRLAKDRNPRLKLYNKRSGEIVYQEELIPLILKIEEQGVEIDFSRMYEFTIHLLFETDPVTGNLTVDININGWNVIEKEVIIELG